MQSQLVLSGISQNEDLAPNVIKQPQAMPARMRRQKFYKEVGSLFTFLMIIPVILFVSAYEVFFLMGLYFYIISRKNSIKYRLESPVYEGGKGLLLIGRDRNEFSNIFASDSLCRQHLLVMGSTGSGKTRFLMSILYQSMVMGSGCMYVDGKADNTVFWLVFSVCQRLDRIDDFIVINYLTTEDTLLKEKNASIRGNSEILTNTMNPYSSGSSEGLRSMTVGLMRDSGGDGDMWKGRASSLLAGTMRFLTYLREADIIQMSVLSIRDSMPLDNVLRIVFGEYNGSSKIVIGDNVIDTKELVVPEFAIRPLKKYLADLPGFNDKAALENDIDGECYKQHGFLTMQLTEALSDLSETYGHIFNSPIGEVDFTDLIQSRRILFVMLPALQRDPDALSNLGKLIIASIRSALGPALGSEVEGYKWEVIDKKATNASEPFFIILDEYGYYSVKGFALVAAQARSLGVSVVFAGQDYAGFKKGSADEAESVIANTNVKIAMKLEEKTTVELFVNRAGKKHTPIVKGLEKKDGMFGNKIYKNQDNISYELINVIDENDLYGQDAGEAHIIISNQVYRVNLFSLLVKGEGNGTTLEVPYTRLNRFLMVRPPDSAIAKDFKEKRHKMHNAVHKTVDNSLGQERDPMIDKLFSSFRREIGNKKGVFDSTLGAVAFFTLDENEKEMMRPKPKVAEKPVANTVKSNADKVAEKEAEEVVDHVGINHQQGQYKQESLSAQADESASFFEGIMDNLMSVGGDKPIREQLTEVATEFMGDEEAGKKDAAESLRIMEDKFKYPVPPKPQKQRTSNVKEKLNSLAGRIQSIEVNKKEEPPVDEDESDGDISDHFPM